MGMSLLGEGAGMADDGSGNPIADSYGSATATAGTIIKRLVPGRASLRVRITDLVYTTAGTSHTISIMPTLVESTITQDAASGQAIIKVSSIPTNPLDGTILAASDWVSFKYEDGSWEADTVASISGTSVTLTNNLDRNVDATTKVYFHFAPADHTTRRITTPVSTTITLTHLITAPGKGQPVIVHSDNPTAAGVLVKLGYTYVEGNPG